MSAHTLFRNPHFSYFKLLLKFSVKSAIIEAIPILFYLKLDHVFPSQWDLFKSILLISPPELSIILMSLRTNHLARVFLPLVLWFPMCKWKVPIFNHMLKQEK